MQINNLIPIIICINCKMKHFNLEIAKLNGKQAVTSSCELGAARQLRQRESKKAIENCLDLVQTYRKKRAWTRFQLAVLCIIRLRIRLILSLSRPQLIHRSHQYRQTEMLQLVGIYSSLRKRSQDHLVFLLLLFL